MVQVDLVEHQVLQEQQELLVYLKQAELVVVLDQTVHQVQLV